MSAFFVGEKETLHLKKKSIFVTHHFPACSATTGGGSNWTSKSFAVRSLCAADELVDADEVAETVGDVRALVRQALAARPAQADCDCEEETRRLSLDFRCEVRALGHARQGEQVRAFQRSLLFFLKARARAPLFLFQRSLKHSAAYERRER